MPISTDRKPSWIRVKIGQNDTFKATRARLKEKGLYTVCEEAFCPNLGHCWKHGRATIMILGDRCSRNCRFCNVDHRELLPPEQDEPRRVAEAVKEAGLKETVLTSVTRDDLPDNGAAHWAETIRYVKKLNPDVLIEVLTPDFQGHMDQLDLVLETHPHIFSHNLETIPRLYPEARPQADYQRSLAVLKHAADAGHITKTSLMLGLGETMDEIQISMQDAYDAGCRIFYAGQYLQPSPAHLPLAGYVTPDEFAEIEKKAYDIGFNFVACAPLVRSSYHKEGQSEFVRKTLRTNSQF
ncbi:MAG: lipoyl synthase [Kiritimatiellae bacterium]|jgi:lipoic acid synthetase|nr:lipoyl synthase [Kiritimatiellia bacterium]